MHPSISYFPNSKFYANKILDGPNVKTKAYEKKFLHGPMFGSYSFIDINEGKEEKDGITQSWKNMVEVDVVGKIIHNLYKGTIISLYLYVYVYLYLLDNFDALYLYYWKHVYIYIFNQKL